MVNQTRQLGQGAGQIGRFLLEGAHQTAPANLLAHPALKERLGGFSEIKLRIKLAARALGLGVPAPLPGARGWEAKGGLGGPCWGRAGWLRG